MEKGLLLLFLERPTKVFLKIIIILILLGFIVPFPLVTEPFSREEEFQEKQQKKRVEEGATKSIGLYYSLGGSRAKKEKNKELFLS